MTEEEKEQNENTHIAIFNGKVIRRKLVGDKWFFSVVDVVGALTDSVDAKDYWYRLKQREKENSGIELSTFCRQLKLKSADGKEYETDCADTEEIFRIIQSIPSKKAEPFKRWLAKIGYERVQEIETSRFAFFQSPYFSLRVKKANLNGAQELEHAPDFSPRVLDNPELAQEKMKKILIEVRD